MLGTIHRLTEMWKKTNGEHNHLKQQKFVEFLLFWAQFSSSDYKGTI